MFIFLYTLYDLFKNVMLLKIKSTEIICLYKKAVTAEKKIGEDKNSAVTCKS